MRCSDSVGQAVRAARVVGNVAADGATLLAARIWGEVQTKVCNGLGKVEVQQTRLDPRLTILGVDRQQSIHLGE